MRIISGKWKRRKLSFPDRPGLRPSLGRLRETLFNWLGTDLDGLSCLDLYAGSGALGFEALSRGASRVTMLDADAAVVSSLNRNREVLQAENCRILRARAVPWLTRQQDHWHVVFIDPPFDGDELARVLPALLAGQAVDAASKVYLEFNAHRPPALEGWRTLKSTRAGDAAGLLIQPLV